MKLKIDLEVFKEVTNLAKLAGDEILKIYNRDFAVFEKSDQSPLTEADLAANEIITKGLTALTPHIPLISEESSGVDWQTRNTWSTYWLIDPLDGTKEFMKKNGEFTVNIALIQNANPIWGVVHAPSLNITYFGGGLGGESFKIEEEKPIKIQVSESPKNKTGWRIVGSRSHQSQEFLTFISRFESPEITSIGSSLKICFVAEGRADIYPRLGPTSEWDTAAAHAVLQGAGGDIFNLESEEILKYNQKESYLNPHFIAANSLSAIREK